ncbi:MAG: hypothetical protein F9B45_10330 [Phycisphaera sp. RhM]|nr:hypothetical protein [Phycisphaera sp. RhM]
MDYNQTRDKLAALCALAARRVLYESQLHRIDFANSACNLPFGLLKEIESTRQSLPVPFPQGIVQYVIVAYVLGSRRSWEVVAINDDLGAADDKMHSDSLHPAIVRAELRFASPWDDVYTGKGISLREARAVHFDDAFDTELHEGQLNRFRRFGPASAHFSYVYPDRANFDLNSVRRTLYVKECVEQLRQSLIAWADYLPTLTFDRGVVDSTEVTLDPGKTSEINTTVLLDEIAGSLRGLDYRLFNRLRHSRHFVGFQSLLEDCWDRPVQMASIRRAIERLNERLLDTCISVELDQERARLSGLNADNEADK